MEQDSGISSIRKSPPVSNLERMDLFHTHKDEKSIFDDYGGREGYLAHIYEAEKIYGREYRSALEQAIYLTWSTGKKHTVMMTPKGISPICNE